MLPIDGEGKGTLVTELPPMPEDIFEDTLEQGEAKRKLATVQTIDKLYPIEGADRIKLATFKEVGWKVVVGVDSFNEGDQCIYCEIDSLLPVENFPELEKCGGRIKTIKLRGQISQGYCIPMSEAIRIMIDRKFPMGCFMDIKKDMDGDDWTDRLGIKKYVKKVTEKGEGGGLRLGRTTGDFPTHLISKTDEERVQSCKKLLNWMQGKPYYITLKMDGSSCTTGYDEEFFLASRNQKKAYDLEFCSFAKAIDKYKLKEKYESIPEFQNYIMQGECCGVGIQKNKLGLSDLDLFIFNILNKRTQRMLDYDEQFELAETYGFKLVPLVEKGDSFSHTIESLQALSRGVYEGTQNQREGIVIRSYGDEFMSQYGCYISFKMINELFSLKED